MKRRRIMPTLTLAIIATGAIAFFSLPRATALSSVTPSPGRGQAEAQRPTSVPIPDHIPYEFLFRRIKFFQDKRMPPQQLSLLLQKELEINAVEAESLIQIAIACLDEVKQQDERAQKVIKGIRARYPGGRIRHGQEPSLVSPELATMQQERNDMILRARTSLQSHFGRGKFLRFDGKVKSKLDGGRTTKRAAAR